MNDYLGREIQRGDRLVYPVRRGSTMRLKEVTVTEIHMEKIVGQAPNGWRTNIKNTKNSVIVPHATV